MSRQLVFFLVVAAALPTFAADTLPPEVRSILRVQRAQAKARARVARISYRRYGVVPRFQSSSGCQTSRRMQQVMKQAASQRLEQEFYRQMRQRRRSPAVDVSRLLGAGSQQQQNYPQSRSRYVLITPSGRSH